MKPKRQLRDEQMVHAVTKGKGEQAKPLPETIALTESQACAIQALGNDEANLIAELQRVDGILQQVRARREKILAEIGTVDVAGIISFYTFDGQQLVKKSE